MTQQTTASTSKLQSAPQRAAPFPKRGALAHTGPLCNLISSQHFSAPRHIIYYKFWLNSCLILLEQKLSVCFFNCCVCVCVSCSVASNSLQSQGLQPSKLLCPQNFPGGWSGLPFPSPGVFPTQGLNLGLLPCRRILSHLSGLDCCNVPVYTSLSKKFIEEGLKEASYSMYGTDRGFRKMKVSVWIRWSVMTITEKRTVLSWKGMWVPGT